MLDCKEIDMKMYLLITIMGSLWTAIHLTTTHKGSIRSFSRFKSPSR